MLRAAACVDESDHHALMYVYLNCSKKLKLVISCGGCCHQPDRGPRILHTPTPRILHIPVQYCMYVYDQFITVGPMKKL